jgi:signal transduction histidine kinase
MAADAVRTGEIVVLETPEAIRERYPALVPGMLTLGTQSLIAIPMRIDGRTAGVLVFNFDTPRTADESERRFLTAIAQQCAQALERARLYEAERVAREESERARAAADEANRAKTEFLTTMSHELRTPLNAIDGYAELLEMEIHGPITDAQRGALQRIRRSQRHLLSLINDVLNFAKLEVGKVELHFEELAIRPLLQSVGELVEPQLRAKGLTYECHAGDARVHAWADREKLQQIVLNLLSNAIKFTAPGGRVELSADATEDLVLVHVADTGRGIPAEMLQAIFEPFVQVRRSLHTTAEGTGLGLAISRDLARAMDGDLTVESAEGRGSRFTVELRRIDRTLEPRLTPANAAAPELPRDR